MSGFVTRCGAWLLSDEVEHKLAEKPMKGGKEHRVAYLPSQDRVLKVADARKLATESVFDYLSDLVLSNHYFDDDIHFIGACDIGGSLHIVTSQPYINGIHPDWPELREGIAKHHLRDPAPRSQGGNFIFDDELLGEVDVFDLHPNNVIRDSTGWLNPIDAHFYFHDRRQRIAAMRKLVLLR